MRKVLVVVLTSMLLLTITACGHKAQDDQGATANQETTGNQDTKDQTVEISNLTEEEKTLVGIWEAEDGWLLAIKERNLGKEEKADNFDFDCIVYDSKVGEWFKVTREESSFNKEENNFIIQDVHMCPDPMDPEGSSNVKTTYRLEYNIDDDSIDYCYLIEEEEVEPHTFYRTDKSVDEADWDWYYDIHPRRK